MKKTSLYEKHLEAGGKMVPFAGYEMPIQYPNGIISEHNQVREKVGLFDVSHMGQITISGENVAGFLSKITPSNFNLVKDGGCKYTVLTNETGGIIDDLIITRFSDVEFGAVINAACAEKDIKWIESQLPENVSLEVLDKSLLAVQGPLAERVLNELVEDADLSEQKYMTAQYANIKNVGECLITRTGYTGEDGFEISISNDLAPKLWDVLNENENLEPAGLGARDILRLEMGYPLYGHDMDDKTTPVEAGLGWVVSKNHEGFLGEAKIAPQKKEGASVKRLGLKLNKRVVAREGAEVFKAGKKIGRITSGGFSPQLQAPIAHCYVEKEEAQLGSEVIVQVRGKEYPAELVKFPFVEAGTKK